ncbi:hypothetical protein J8273_7411 [Carpediemonas membranifera]|uniref:Uncharacterized protein n=1 Tax=Carpediemonas membranifera TaxID=201153 RepID=A0A8J6B6Q7_9EUKA|nr:hypothetical protein J8273_7411 [Carpediemonas membranifera]|eukprot:KAG9391137.1 hypothetical protein J8273_7411 [Carpediemonas membranifera]
MRESYRRSDIKLKKAIERERYEKSRMDQERVMDELNDFEHQNGIKLHTKKKGNRFSDRLKAHKEELHAMGVDVTKPRNERASLATYFDYSIQKTEDFHYDRAFAAKPSHITSPVHRESEEALSVLARGTRRPQPNTASRRNNNTTLERVGVSESLQRTQMTRVPTQASFHRSRPFVDFEKPLERPKRSLSATPAASRLGTIRLHSGAGSTARPVQPALGTMTEGADRFEGRDESDGEEEVHSGSLHGGILGDVAMSSAGYSTVRDDEDDNGRRASLNAWELQRQALLRQFDDEFNAIDRTDPHDETDGTEFGRRIVPDRVPAMLTRSAPNRHSLASARERAKSTEPTFKPQSFHPHESLPRMRGHISFMEPIFLESGPSPMPIRPASSMQFYNYSSKNNTFDDLMKDEDKRVFGSRTMQAQGRTDRMNQRDKDQRDSRLNTARDQHLSTLRARSSASRSRSAMLRSRLGVLPSKTSPEATTTPVLAQARPRRRVHEDPVAAMNSIDQFDFKIRMSAIR